MRVRFTLPLSLFCWIFLTTVAPAQEQPQATPGTAEAEAEPLRVAVAGQAPFVLAREEDSALRGMAVDLWQSLAREAGIEYELERFDDVSEALEALEENAVDLVIGPVSITAEREERVTFTQPFYISSLGIVSRNDSLWGRLKPFFSWQFFVAVGVFLLILGAVGALVWLAERNSGSEAFEKGPLAGIGNGLWLALVTMTTVGYGDLAPRTVKGRVVLGIWMVVALLSATSLLAGLASTLTRARSDGSIENAEELDGNQVAVIGVDSPAGSFVREHGGTPKAFPHLEEAFRAVEDGEVGALVFDRPQLRYYLSTKRPGHEMGLASAEYRPQGYGFAFGSQSEQLKRINLALLEAQADGELKTLEEQWLGTTGTEN